VFDDGLWSFGEEDTFINSIKESSFSAQVKKLLMAIQIFWILAGLSPSFLAEENADRRFSFCISWMFSGT
jgi:hypothetical protein